MNSLLCWMFGHKYKVLKKLSLVERKVGCKRCKCTWAMHDEVRAFLPWDGEFEQMYKESES